MTRLHREELISAAEQKRWNLINEEDCFSVSERIQVERRHAKKC